MLNITELKAKAASNDMSIVDVVDGLYQIYHGDHTIGAPQDLEDLNNADTYGVFDGFDEIDREQDNVEFLCTNGSNSNFRVWAADADTALTMAVKRFDSESGYILPINVESECGQLATHYADNKDGDIYTADEMGLNDDY